MYISFIVSIRPSLIHLHGFHSCLCCCHSSHKITFFNCINIMNPLNLKFKQTSNCCKRVLEAYGNKTKESITSQKPGSRDFLHIANSVLNKDKSAIPPLFSEPRVLSSASDKAKWFALSEKTFLRTLI